MQIVINVSKEFYENLLKNHRFNSEEIPIVGLAIATGTPLPKGHGRLIDELELDLFAPSLGTDEYVNDLMAKHNIDYVNGNDEDKIRVFAMDLIHGCMNVIKTASTIIEADKGSEDKE